MPRKCALWKEYRTEATSRRTVGAGALDGPFIQCIFGSPQRRLLRLNKKSLPPGGRWHAYCFHKARACELMGFLRQPRLALFCFEKRCLAMVSFGGRSARFINACKKTFTFPLLCSIIMSVTHSSIQRGGKNEKINRYCCPCSYDPVGVAAVRMRGG